MASKLVIVESPAKARTLKRFLGKKYKVEASMGHLIDLPKSKLGVDIENNFRPHYITIRGKGKILSQLKKEAKKVDEVLLATDPDREGEAISWHLKRALSIPNEKCRVVFNEITKGAVKKAMEDPRDIDGKLVDAQQARRVLDRLVGYKLSPLLWKKVKKGLSAGRVQTVAVRLVCEREREIEDFKEEEYWTITGNFKAPKGDFKARLFRIDSGRVKIENEEQAKKLVTELKKEEFTIIKIKERKRKRRPLPPFITSTLQQEAIRRLNFTARKTMAVAQQLYEGLQIGGRGHTGLITYMRTDSVRTSPVAQKAARKVIGEKFGPEFLPKNPQQYKGKKSSQDAHEAIRPTDPTLTPEKAKTYLNKDQFKLYKIIWERFLASQMTPAEFFGLNVDVGGGRFTFRANGSQVIFPGFLKLLGTDNIEENILPELKEGEKVKLKKLEEEQHFTQPPPRFTEGTLVKELEAKGIGRPSTYAPIVSTIQQRGYIVSEEKRFKPTELGFKVNDLLVSFFPEITEVQFTAQMEEKLDQVEENQEDWVGILKDFYKDFKIKLDKAQEQMQEVEIEDEKTDIKCEKCGAQMVIKHGRFGKFLACPNFPECKNTKPYMLLEDIDCFKCGKGKIVQRKSKKGRTFFGCDRFPDCDYVSWSRPLSENCPKCGAFLLEKKGKKGARKVCAREECDFVQGEDKGGKD